MPYKNKDAQRAYQAEWIRAQRSTGTSVADTRRTRLEAKIRWLYELKADKPCADCGGIFHPVAMQYDHLDATTKTFSISTMIRSNYSLKRIEEEIAKCELVCANCHSIRGYLRHGDRPHFWPISSTP